MQVFLSNAGFPPDTVLDKRKLRRYCSGVYGALGQGGRSLCPRPAGRSESAGRQTAGRQKRRRRGRGLGRFGGFGAESAGEDLWGLPCQIYGFVSGANYLHDQQVIEAPLLTGDIESYMFSQRNNRALRRRHRVGQLYSVFIEMMLASPSPSFLQYEETENGGVALRFDCPETEGYESIRQMQKGILTFIADYQKAFTQYPYMLRVSGEDAYHVCGLLSPSPATSAGSFRITRSTAPWARFPTRWKRSPP